jgi:hypothetical protein
MVSPVGDKFFDRGERCSPASCLQNLRYPPYLASSSTAAKSLRSLQILRCAGNNKSGAGLILRYLFV